ncbi:hypothetical protein E2C01_055252 [Portunus trituberculatus]|uniref:Uncharacterized protein n=1 Tax=Portunus trituberculatus TaxID=210409 RepID=A0A5B7GVG0_PORTR|nr:hypothetical protein [Portunus trituberculatus]
MFTITPPQNIGRIFPQKWSEFFASSCVCNLPRVARRGRRPQPPPPYSRRRFGGAKGTARPWSIDLGRFLRAATKTDFLSGESLSCGEYSQSVME